MTTLVAGRGLPAPAFVRHRAPALADLPPFIAWLRQVRRSAWVLIVLCSIFRIGDALTPEPAFSPGGSAAIAAEIR